MKIRISTTRIHEKGYALALVIVFAGIGIFILTGAMNWTSNNARQNDRNNRYFAAVAAAEGATEMVMAGMLRDFNTWGESEVYNNMNGGRYETNVPSAGHDAYWNKYQFSTPAGVANNALDGKTYMTRKSVGVKRETAPPYAGLYSLTGTYRVISDVREANAGVTEPVTAAVGQEVDLSLIPAFQFAIFYNLDLEINPGPPMMVAGKVHSNGDIYTEPQDTLTFLGDVTAVGEIYPHKSPNDPSSRTPGTINFQGEHTGGEDRMDIPGVDNSTNTAHRILEYPEAGEDISSLAGKERYYNKADMVIIVTDNGIIVSNGPTIQPPFTLPQNEAQVFISTNGTFWNEREDKNIQLVDIDVAKLREWAKTNNVNIEDPNILFVDDQRSVDHDIVTTNYYYSTNYTTNFAMTTTTSFPAAGTYRPPVSTNCNSVNVTNTSLPAIPPRCPGFTPFKNAQGKWVYRTIGTYTYERIIITQNVMTNRVLTTNNVIAAESGVRLKNGERLPAGGLTVASPDPVYIWGDYNVTDGSGNYSRGTTNTMYTEPSSIIADAINILSGAWTDTNSTANLDQRVATNTTLNAALLGGIVPSDGESYSGGVENFPRFLEKWENGGKKKVFTYNGSMIVLFESEIATSPWGSGNVYVPPKRDWTFDMNFTDIDKLPPGTPHLQKFGRYKWATLRPGETTF